MQTAVQIIAFFGYIVPAAALLILLVVKALLAAESLSHHIEPLGGLIAVKCLLVVLVFACTFVAVRRSNRFWLLPPIIYLALVVVSTLIFNMYYIGGTMADPQFVAAQFHMGMI